MDTAEAVNARAPAERGQIVAHGVVGLCRRTRLRPATGLHRAPAAQKFKIEMRRHGIRPMAMQS
jgi:hypothetical protein